MADTAPVDIQINDKVDRGIALEIQSIAEAAREADGAIAGLRSQLATIDASRIRAITAAVNDNSRAYLANEAALNKSIIAEQKAATASLQTQIAKQKLSTEIQNTSAASMKAEAALNSAVVAEQKAAAATADETAGLIAKAKATEDAAAAQLRYNALISPTLAGQRSRSAAGSASAFQADARALQQLGAAQATAITNGVRLVSSIEQQAATFGKSAAEIAEYRAAQLGVSAEAAPFIEKLKALEAAQLAAAAATGHMNTAVVGEGLVLAREAANGNWTRFTSSFTRMIQLSGLMEAVFSPMGLLIIAATAAVAGLAIAMERGEAQTEKMRNTLLTTSNAAGLTLSSWRALDEEIATSSNTTLSKADKAISALASSGKVSGQTLELLGKSAVQLSQFTGESSDKIAQDFLRMTEGVTKYAIEFEQAHGMISAAQIEYIRQLENRGDKERAELQLSKDLYNGIQQLGEEKLGDLQKLWRSLGQEIDSVVDKLMSIGREKTPLEQLAAVNKQIQDMQNPVNLGLSTVLPDWVSGIKSGSSLHDLELQRDMLQDVINQDRDKAALDAQNIQRQKEAVDSGEHLAETMRSIAKGSQLAAQDTKDFLSWWDKAKAGGQTTINGIPMTDQLKNQMIAGIQKRDDPQDAKLAAEAQKRADAIADINKKLADQGIAYGLLSKEQTEQNELNSIEESYYKRFHTLVGLNISDIKSKIAANENEKLVQQQANRIYDEANKPLENYGNSLKAIAELEAKHKITAIQAADATIEASNALSSALHVNYGREWTDAQKVEAVTAQIKTLYDANAGAVRNLAAQYTALNIAQTRGIISQRQYTIGMQQLGLAALKLKIDMDQANVSDILLHGIGSVVKDYKGMFQSLSTIADNFFNEFADGFGNVIGQVITGQESIGQGFQQIAQQILSELIGALIKLGIQWVITNTLGAALGAAATGAAGIEAGILATAWEPAALLASIATMGGADAVGTAALATAMGAGAIENMIGTSIAQGGGYDTGGWTGDIGRNKIAGVVHGQEFVVRAGPANDNLPLLNAINNGMDFNKVMQRVMSNSYIQSQAPQFNMAPAARSTPPKIVIEQHGTAQVYMVKSFDENEIRLMARDEANSVVVKRAPDVISAQIKSPGSQVSKTLGEHTNVQRRR